MQPYFFPYICYFQLIDAVDSFIFYDDVNFIKQGWINRNRILLNGAPHLFSVPLESLSSFTEIKDTAIHKARFETWRGKFLKTIEHAYKKAPFYKETAALIDHVLNANLHTVSDIAEHSIMTITKHIQLKTTFAKSSQHFGDTKGLEKTERLIEISRRMKASKYVNPVGGTEIYHKADFMQQGIQLQFIKPSDDIIYQQYKGLAYVANLSIIDVLMFNGAIDTRRLLNRYELI